MKLGTSPHGFTLIEVLVVVAIIAVLVSILLPSLKKAREQARSAACASHLGQILRAENTYETGNKEYIPGTPMTTGWWFVANSSLTWAAGVNGQPNLVGWFDWFTPIRAEMQGRKSLPPDQIKLYQLGTEGIFHCPSNPYMAIWSYYGGTGEFEQPGPTIRAFSYLPIQQFMLPMKSAVPARFSAGAEYNNGFRVTQWSKSPVVAPSTYVPRRSKIGRASVKVFLADGVRSENPTGSQQDFGPKFYYITAMRSSRGGILSYPPSEITPLPSGGKPWRGAWTVQRKYSYRHGNNNRINAGFFDGHVQSLWYNDHGQMDGQTYEGFTGPAVTPYYYYPSGSIVKNPNNLHKNTVPEGLKLQ